MIQTSKFPAHMNTEGYIITNKSKTEIKVLYERTFNKSLDSKRF